MQADSKFVLYGVPGSPPCRSVCMYFALSHQPFEFKMVNIGGGETHTEEYFKINPIGLVPALSHNDFNLGECSAILTYLAKVWKDQKYYSDDAKKCAKIQMYFSYHPSARRQLAMLFMEKYRIFFAKYFEIPSKEECLKKFEGACKEFEKIWLSNGNKFLTGDELTICDLQAFTEFQQAQVGCGYDFSQNFPKIMEWMKRIYEVPEFKDVDNVLKDALAFMDQRLNSSNQN